MEKSVIFGVDEITAMLFGNLQDIESMSEWVNLAEKIVNEFEIKSQITKIIGEKRPADESKPSGYTSAYSYGYNPFYFSVAYNSSQPKMGVIVKFSAYAWNYYTSIYSEEGINLIEFLDSIESNLYQVRLSRIDLTSDYINWDFDVNEIYERLISGRYELRDSNDKRNYSKITAYEIDGTVETFYVGSKKTGTRLFMRIYNKKTEQLDNYGFRHSQALKVKSWVRFEVVLKSTYAHQMTKILQETNSSSISSLIATKIAEKYQFFDTDQEEFTDFTKALNISEDKFQKLNLDSPRDNSIVASLTHLINGSGLFSSMYKCDAVWGEETAMHLLTEMYLLYKGHYHPGEDIKLWIKKHKNTLAKQSFENDVLSLVKIKKPLSRRKITDNGHS